MPKVIYRWGLNLLCDLIVRMLKNKFDCFIVIEGKRGLGKSTMGYHIARRVAKKMQGKEGYSFLPRRDLLFTQKDVLEAINKRWKSIIVADEMVNVVYLRDFYSNQQKKLIKAMNMNRDHCNLIIACVPQFSTLDNQIRNLTKIRITVIRRGFAVLQLPNKTIYSKDIWDTAINEKIEREWLTKNVTRPRYSRLTTFRGFLSFPDLREKQRMLYEEIKIDKRNKILTDEAEKTEEEKKPVDRILEMLEDGRFKKREDFDNICIAMGLKPTNVQQSINIRLRDQGRGDVKFGNFFEGEIKEFDDEKKEYIPQILQESA